MDNETKEVYREALKVVTESLAHCGSKPRCWASAEAPGCPLIDRCAAPMLCAEAFFDASILVARERLKMEGS